MATSNRALHVAPYQLDAYQKKAQRIELDDAVTQVLANGGKIQTLANGERSPEIPVKRRGKAAKRDLNTYFASKKTLAEPTLVEEVRLEDLSAEDEAVESEEACA